jgi:membrane protein
MNKNTFFSLSKQFFDRQFWYEVFNNFNSRRGADSAAILAYTSLIGIVPMLGVMLGMFSVSSFFTSFEDLIMEQVINNLIPNSQTIIIDYLVKFSEQAARLRGPSLIVMLFLTLMLLWKVDQKLNSLWSEKLERKWWVSLLHYVGISLLGPFLLGLSLVASSYLFTLRLFVDSVPWITNLVSGVHLIPIVLAWLGFTALYKLVLIVKVPIKVALLAGLLATLQIEILKYGFALYVSFFHIYAVVYGAFSVIPLFLVWLYSVWFIVVWNGVVVLVMIKNYTK